MLETALGELLAEQDVLILTGGVSMGEFDYVPQVLLALGMELVFHKVLQRPGLPLWFGVSPAGKPVFALPGNPVSSLVCLVRYVAPALVAALGAAPRPDVVVRLDRHVSFEPDLTYFLPVNAPLWRRRRVPGDAEAHQHVRGFRGAGRHRRLRRAAAGNVGVRARLHRAVLRLVGAPSGATDATARPNG